MHVYIYIYIYTHTYILCICIHVCICMCVYIYIYIHIIIFAGRPEEPYRLFSTDKVEYLRRVKKQAAPQQRINNNIIVSKFDSIGYGIRILANSGTWLLANSFYYIRHSKKGA